MRKINKSIGNVLTALLIVVMLFPMNALAARLVDTTKETSLTVHFEPDNTPTQGTEFRIYQIAAMSEYWEFTATESFEKYGINFHKVSQSQWRDLEQALTGYIAADRISPNASAKIDENGDAAFWGLPVGLYLVVGDVFRANDHYYTPQPFLICLPNLNTETDVWEYDVNKAIIKYDKIKDGLINLEILKVWKDNDYSNRPDGIEVEIYSGDTLYKTVALNKDNNWRVVLTDLAGDVVWSVKEKNIPDNYNLVVERQTNRIVLTNILDLPDEPDNPDEQKMPSQGEIEQTGMLWWPVPVMITVGLACILLGYLRRRGSEDEI